MVAAAVVGFVRLALVAGMLIGCGAETAGGNATRSRGNPKDSGTQSDAGDPTDARVEGVCSFTPCGGDLVGSWTIQRVCPASILVQNCPGTLLDARNVTVSGSFTFGSDGMLTIDINSTGTWEGLVPSPCVAGADCGSIAGTLYQPNAPPASCTGDGDGGCACSSPATPKQTGVLAYSINGNTAANMSFCVHDGLLKLMNEAGTVFVATPSSGQP